MSNGQGDNIEFPCDFPIKIMGKADPEFEAKILSIIKKHSPDINDTAIKTKHSKERTYISITAVIPAKSKQQLDALYQELTSDESVLVVL
jgi:uncharacterized protein